MPRPTFQGQLVYFSWNFLFYEFCWIRTNIHLFCFEKIEVLFFFSIRNINSSTVGTTNQCIIIILTGRYTLLRRSTHNKIFVPYKGTFEKVFKFPPILSWYNINLNCAWSIFPLKSVVVVNFAILIQHFFLPLNADRACTYNSAYSSCTQMRIDECSQCARMCMDCWNFSYVPIALKYRLTKPVYAYFSYRASMEFRKYRRFPAPREFLFVTGKVWVFKNNLKLNPLKNFKF